MTSEYVLMENAIVKQLSQIDRVKVESFPEDPEQLDRAQTLSRILVAYKNSTYTEVNEKTDLETAIIQLKFQFKSLRTHQGALPLISEAKKLLIGFYPMDNCNKPLHMVGSSFVNVYEKHWIYSADLSCRFYTGANYDFDEVPDQVIPPVWHLQVGIWRAALNSPLNPEEAELDRVFNFEQT